MSEQTQQTERLPIGLILMVSVIVLGVGMLAVQLIIG